MNRLRLPAVVAVLALGLSGCALAPPGSALGTASPSASADIRVEPELAEELMRDALPSAADAVEVYETAGLDGPSFASDWSVVDHDARRVTRVLRDWQTPGWADPSLGAGYLFGVEIVLMESADAAGAAYNEIAAAIAHPYSYESDDGTVRSDYAPLETPSGRWPFGTVEQRRDQTWASGERASGWIVYYLSGPFILVVDTSAVPGNDSAAALDAYADQVVPALIESLDALPTRLAALAP